MTEVLLSIGQFVVGGVALGLLGGVILGFIAFCLDDWF